ncbi:class I SAM-dependent methyltransferase [Pseudonocardia nigra]|uniref:class I SAM-dependent methyltransferase n=1 Tax=Pseudonocardia nigra TaxID=1921578 RepID=UPI001C5DF297|nr:class I SAM-dependent methyltransferase [Pseudonocardia nigra]
MTEHTSPRTGQDRSYLPGMGRDPLLPIYDTFTRVLGVPTAHRFLADRAGIAPGQDVLEIGCGTGNLALLVKRRYPDARVVGLDPDPLALARAARKAARRGLTVRLDRGFGDTLPYPDGSFDRVLSAFMFHHLDAAEKPAVLREVVRVLRPGGRLHLLDIGGSAHPSHGFLARRTHASPRIQDNLSDRIPALMREAGLADARETHHVRIRAGRCAVFEGTR